MFFVQVRMTASTGTGRLTRPWEVRQTLYIYIWHNDDSHDKLFNDLSHVSDIDIVLERIELFAHNDILTHNNN